MERLIKVGFKHVGVWNLLANDTIKYELFKPLSSTKILYAFVQNSNVMYIGKTTKTLDERIKFYAKPGARQSTNIRVNLLIKNTLKQGGKIDIYMFENNSKLEYEGYQLCLASALEDILIRKINSEWNFAGRERIVDEIENETEPLEILIPMESKEDELFLTLRKTYYNKGFFNIPKIHSESFGPDYSEVNIFLGSTMSPVKGIIDRRANGNPENVRIRAGKNLIRWIQANFEEMDRIHINIINPILIQITKPI